MMTIGPNYCGISDFGCPLGQVLSSGRILMIVTTALLFDSWYYYFDGEILVIGI